MLPRIDLHYEPITRARVDTAAADLRRKAGVALAGFVAALVSLATVPIGWFVWASTIACLLAGWYALRFTKQRTALLQAAQPISGDDCRQMAEWWDQHPTLDAYCRRVVGQGREIMQMEFDAASDFVASKAAQAYRAALYDRPDAVPSPVDDALLDSLTQRLGTAPCAESSEALALIQQYRGYAFDDPREAKRFIDLVWDCVTRVLDHHPDESDSLASLRELEIELAHRSIALRRVDFGTMPSRTIAVVQPMGIAH
jgi:hypothetical protein